MKIAVDAVIQMAGRDSLEVDSIYSIGEPHYEEFIASAVALDVVGFYSYIFTVIFLTILFAKLRKTLRVLPRFLVSLFLLAGFFSALFIGLGERIYFGWGYYNIIITIFFWLCLLPTVVHMFMTLYWWGEMLKEVIQKK